MRFDGEYMSGHFQLFENACQDRTKVSMSSLIGFYKLLNIMQLTSLTFDDGWSIGGTGIFREAFENEISSCILETVRFYGFNSHLIMLYVELFVGQVSRIDFA